MSTITVNITYNNNDTLTVNTTKDKLLKLEYFNSFFEFGETPEIINMSLNNFKYDNIQQPLKVLFEYLETETKIETTTKQFILSNNDKDGTYYVAFNTSLNLPIYEYYILLELSDYFGFSMLNHVIKLDAFRYHNFITSYCKTKKVLGSHYLNYTVKGKLDNIYTDQDLIEKYIWIVIYDELKQNIYKLHTLYNNLDFNKYFSNIRNWYIEIPKLYENFYIANDKLENPTKFVFAKRILDDDLKKYPLDAILNTYKTCNIYYDPQIMFKIYDYYDILAYEPTKCEKYHTDNYTTPIYGIPSIKSNFNELFATETNNMFDNFDWSNIIIAGGFVFGLMNNVCNSIIDSTDIDMYVYGKQSGSGSEKDVIATRNYILQYFEQYGANYVISKQLITIVIPTIKYDIQLIIMDDTTPKDIVTAFDINFTELYYDGKDVYTSLNCMYALKYQVAVFNKNERNLDIRICKTLMKGLRIQVNNYANNSELFVDDKKDDVSDGNVIDESVSPIQIIIQQAAIPQIPIQIPFINLDDFMHIKGKKKKVREIEKIKNEQPPEIKTPKKIYFDSKKVDTIFKAQNFNKQKSVRYAYNNMAQSEFYINMKELYDCHGIITSSKLLINSKLAKSSFDEYVKVVDINTEDKNKITGSINKYNYHVTFGDQIVINIF